MSSLESLVECESSGKRRYSLSPGRQTHLWCELLAARSEQRQRTEDLCHSAQKPMETGGDRSLPSKPGARCVPPELATSPLHTSNLGIGGCTFRAGAFPGGIREGRCAMRHSSKPTFPDHAQKFLRFKGSAPPLSRLAHKQHEALGKQGHNEQ